ncbi:hypothetical protein EJ419_02135 [Alloscardovia theropitheci]|uniref:Uncharacterized protein n=1 Tax=Alloscardovia theropitheci TaxID=2496842 RepID=A0A4R0QTN0_9BIFI|nr:hypothetical protein [Alloscardovia theropitheci]TCD54655.1 hypothetical protein EJ419_02135 [Alloscardovia theropitheci]
MAKSEGWYERNPWAKDRASLDYDTFDVSYVDNLSLIMKSFLPAPLFLVKNNEKKVFSVKGVKLKALGYLVWLALAFVVSYFFVDFDVSQQTDSQKMISFIFIILIPVWFALPMWLNGHYTVIAFIFSRFCELAFLATVGYLAASGVTSRPSTLPLVIVVFTVSVLCVLFIDRLTGSKVGLLTRTVGVLGVSISVAYFLSRLAVDVPVFSVFAGLFLAVFAILSFYMDSRVAKVIADYGNVHSRYEWAFAFCLVFDVVLCVVGLVKATGKTSSDISSSNIPR